MRAIWTRVLSLYADDIVLFSPHARERVGTGRIAGIAALRRYWTAGGAAGSQFELDRVLVGDDCVTILYWNHRGQTVAETFEFGAADLIARSYACYGGGPRLDVRRKHRRCPSIDDRSDGFAHRPTPSPGSDVRRDDGRGWGWAGAQPAFLFTPIA